MADLHKDFDKETDLNKDFDKESVLHAEFDKEPSHGEISLSHATSTEAPEETYFGMRPRAVMESAIENLPSEGALAGGMVGGLMGAPAGGVGAVPGAVAGSTMGGAAGSALKRLINAMRGKEVEPGYLGGVKELGEGAVIGLEQEMGGQVIGKAASMAGPGIKKAVAPIVSKVQQKLSSSVSPGTRYIGEGIKQGQAGVDMSLPKTQLEGGAANKAIKEAEGFVVNRIEPTEQVLGQDVSNSIKNAQANGTRINITDDVSEAATKLENAFDSSPLLSENKEAKAVLNKIRSLKQPSVPKQSPPTETPTRSVDYDDAVKQLEGMDASKKEALMLENAEASNLNTTKNKELQESVNAKNSKLESDLSAKRAESTQKFEAANTELDDAFKYKNEQLQKKIASAKTPEQKAALEAQGVELKRVFDAKKAKLQNSLKQESFTPETAESIPFEPKPFESSWDQIGLKPTDTLSSTGKQDVLNAVRGAGGRVKTVAPETGPLVEKTEFATIERPRQAPEPELPASQTPEKYVSPTDAKMLMDHLDDALDKLRGDDSTAAMILKDNIFSFRKSLDRNLKTSIPEYSEAADRFHDFRKAIPETIMSQGKSPDTTKIWAGNLKNARGKTVDSVTKMFEDVTAPTGNSVAKKTYSRLSDSLKELEASEAKREALAKAQGKPFKSVFETMGLKPDEVRQFILQKGDEVGAQNTVMNETGKASTLNPLGAVKSYVQSKAVTLGNKVGLYAMPKEHLNEVAQKLSASPGTSHLGQALFNALDQTNEQSLSKNAIIFSILQNPQARKILNPQEEVEQKNTTSGRANNPSGSGF